MWSSIQLLAQQPQSVRHSARHRACPERHPGGCPLLRVGLGLSPGQLSGRSVSSSHMPYSAWSRRVPCGVLGTRKEAGETIPAAKFSSHVSVAHTRSVPPGQWLQERRCFCRWGWALNAVRPSPAFTWRRLLFITELFYRKKKKKL